MTLPYSTNYSTYSIESLTERLQHLGLPFADFFARALVALLTAQKISLHHVTHLMPGEQNPEPRSQSPADAPLP